MAKFIKENWKTLLSFLFIIIFIPVIILTPSKYGRIPREIGLQLVGYGGSILGGFLTLYGVWWTINDQSEKRKSELIEQYKPILILKSESVNFVLQKFAIQSKFTLYNNGRGEASNIEINVIESNCFVFPQVLGSNILTANDNIELIINITKEQNRTELKMDDAIQIDDSDKLNFTLEIVYTGSFEDEYTYKTLIKISIEQIVLIDKPFQTPSDQSAMMHCWFARVMDTQQVKEHK